MPKKNFQFVYKKFTKPEVHMFKTMRKLLMMPILVNMFVWYDQDIVWKGQDALFH
jgi:hypothetical protein